LSIISWTMSVTGGPTAINTTFTPPKNFGSSSLALTAMVYGL